jgi:NADPH:quinone reductase-like Zn-dependent oxidoreductase
MRAWTPHDPQGAMIRLAEVARPEPGPDQAVVCVEAYSINRGETLLLERPRPRWRPGKDVAGTVVRAARSGRGPREGARVVGHPADGGWAEQVAVDVDSVAELPPSICSVTAAALPLAGLTALRLIRQAGPLVGRRLLITGASGGVGHYVVELAAAAGADVTAISATPERGFRLRELGADSVVPDVADASGSFDIVMESVGGESLVQCLPRLRPEGLMLWFGQASRSAPTIDFFSFFDGPVQASIRHVDYTRGERTFGEDLRTLVALVDGGRLHPEIGAVRPWTESPAVIAQLRSRAIRGNAVLTVNVE